MLVSRMCQLTFRQHSFILVHILQPRHRQRRDHVAGHVQRGVDHVDGAEDADHHAHDRRGKAHRAEQHDRQHDTAVRDARRADGNQRRHEDEHRLLIERQVDAVNLRDKKHRDRIISGDAVHIHRRAQRQRKRRQLVPDVKLLLRDPKRHRQRAGTGRGAERHPPDLGNLAEEIGQRDLRDALDDKEINEDDDRRRRHIMRQDEFSHDAEHGKPVSAGAARGQRANAVGRRPHHKVGDREHDLRRLVDDFLDARGLFPENRQRHADKHRKNDSLHQVALRESRDGIRRHHAENRRADGHRLRRLDRLAGLDNTRNAEAAPRLHQMRYREAEDRRQDRRHHIKSHDLRADTLQLRHIPDTGDAADDRTENQRNHDHLDQLQKKIADRLHEQDFFLEDQSQHRADTEAEKNLRTHGHFLHTASHLIIKIGKHKSLVFCYYISLYRRLQRIIYRRQKTPRRAPCTTRGS